MLSEYKMQQPIAYQILFNAIETDHFTHAYIFETNGYEKGLDMALSFAKVLLCPHHYIDNKYCGDCAQCHMIDDNNYLELKIISPDGQMIKKEQLIELQDEFNKKSLVGNKKVYIINHAEKMNNNSANTLLKFIEEPPDGIVAILVVDNAYQLLNTITSRCQLISLNGQADIMENDSTLIKIAKVLNNNIADYETFINENNIIVYVLKFINYYETNGKKILLHMNEYWFDNFTDKDKCFKALQTIIYFYKDCLDYKIGLNIEFFNDYIDNIEKISLKNSISKLTRKLQVLSEYIQYINSNANSNLLMDRIIIEMEEGA